MSGTSGWWRTLVHGIVLPLEQSESTAFNNIFRCVPTPPTLALFSPLLSFGVFCRLSGGPGSFECWLPRPFRPSPVDQHFTWHFKFTIYIKWRNARATTGPTGWEGKKTLKWRRNKYNEWLLNEIAQPLQEAQLPLGPSTNPHPLGPPSAVVCLSSEYS